MMRSLIRGVIHAVMPAYWLIVLWVHACDGTHIHTIFIRVRTALMMGVDAACLAEVVLRRLRAESVEAQVLGAFDNAQIIASNGAVGVPRRRQ
jgi:hypothetical protein